MSRLRLLVPHKALQQYSLANGEWDYTKLASVNFLTIIEHILDDEYFWPHIWREFNKSLPMHSRYNHESWKINSIDMDKQVSRKPNDRGKPNTNKPEQQTPNDTGNYPNRGRNNFRGRYRSGYGDRATGGYQQNVPKQNLNQQQNQPQQNQPQ